MPTEIGTPGPSFLLPTSYTHRMREGVTIQIQYKVRTHILQDWINANASSFEYHAEPIANSPYSYVTISYPTTPDPAAVLADIWGVTYNEFTIDAWLNPTVKNEMAKATPDDQRTWKDMVTQYLGGATSYDLATSAPGPGDPAPPTTPTGLSLASLAFYAGEFGMDEVVMNNFVTSLVSGTVDILVSFPTLHRHVVRPSNTNLSPVFTNVGNIYSTDGLLEFEPTIPANLTVDLPQGWWLRKTPTAEQQDDGRWHYSVEYWFAGTDPDFFIYTNPIGTPPP
jgi:hypothetical protein